MKMNRSYFRMTAISGLLLAALFASTVLPVVQGQQTQTITPSLTPAGLWLNNVASASSLAYQGGSYRTDSYLGGGRTSPDRIRFNFSGYGNPQRPYPGYVGPWQLGAAYIAGSGELRADGTLLSGGRISHTDNLRDRNYPNHNTTWQVIKGLGVTRTGTRTALRLQVQVVSSNYTRICPVGTLGIIDLIDDNSRLANGQTNDGILTTMPNPSSLAPDGGLACRTHGHGMNNMDVAWTEPPYGGAPNGGLWANVEISGGAAATFDISGTWVESWNPYYAGDPGSSHWSLTPLGGNRYQFQQFDHGRATGIAVVTGTRLRIDWSCCGGSWAGYMEYDLDPSGTSGKGSGMITKGDRERVGKRVPTLIRKSR